MLLLLTSFVLITGVEIDDCMMIEDDDRIFLSQGEAFLQPNVNSSASDGIASNVSSREISKDKGLEKGKPAGTVVGPYIVGEILGRGGFGEVRVGTNQLTGEKVALKFIRKSDIQSMGAVERAANEIKCQSILRHTNIIKLEMVRTYIWTFPQCLISSMMVLHHVFDAPAYL